MTTMERLDAEHLDAVLAECTRREADAAEAERVAYRQWLDALGAYEAAPGAMVAARKACRAANNTR